MFHSILYQHFFETQTETCE